MVLILLFCPALIHSQATDPHEASHELSSAEAQQQTQNPPTQNPPPSQTPPAQSDATAQKKTETPPTQNPPAQNPPAQTPPAQNPPPTQGTPPAQGTTPPQNPPATQTTPPAQTPPGQPPAEAEGVQTKRMYWVVPNFAAVSAHTTLPPMTVREKFIVASKDSFDYSSFVWDGILAGQNMAQRADPELGNGMKGYARYYWRGFVDEAVGTFATEAIVPALMHEDPRYYTLGHGSILRRTLYAVSQLYLTKKDSGKIGFNISEIFGNGLAAAASNIYYPPQERGLRNTMHTWGTGLEAAALNNIAKEFWPDIRKLLPWQPKQ